MKHTLSPRVELSESQLRQLAYVAYQYGYMRVEPRKAWSRAEYKEAARYAIVAMALEKAGEQ